MRRQNFATMNRLLFLVLIMIVLILIMRSYIIIRTSSIAKMPPSPFQSADIIHVDNENMNIDGALNNSLLSEPPGSDFR